MSPKRRKKAVLLFDMSEPPPADQDFSELFETEAWDTEHDVMVTLESLGFDVIPVGVFDDLRVLTNTIEQEKPDLIFNQAETFNDRRAKEPYLAALLDLSGIPYTGVSPDGLMVCKNKGLAKKILSFHRIRTPRFLISHRNRPLRRLRRFVYPAFVKPLGMEGSDGISKESFAENEKDCLARATFVHESLNRDAIIEEFIEGRELYVGIFGKNRPIVFPPRELFFKKVPKGQPRFATAAAKWDHKYQERWGIDSGPALKIDETVLRKLRKTCRRAYRALGLDAYARMDIRLKANGEVYILEVNPNPYLIDIEDFAQAAGAHGWDYTRLIEKIVELAFRRAKESAK